MPRRACAEHTPGRPAAAELQESAGASLVLSRGSTIDLGASSIGIVTAAIRARGGATCTGGRSGVSDARQTRSVDMLSGKRAEHFGGGAAVLSTGSNAALGGPAKRRSSRSRSDELV